MLVSSTESFGDKILTYLYPAHSQLQVCHGWVIPHSFILSFFTLQIMYKHKKPTCVMALVCSHVYSSGSVLLEMRDVSFQIRIG